MSKADHSIEKKMRAAEKEQQQIDECMKLPKRLGLAAKSSEMLSNVWTLPPAQVLKFRTGMKLADIDPASTPGFDGQKSQGLEFIDLSTSEIARFQKLMYANGKHGGKRRLLIVLQGMDASGKGGIVEHVFRQVNPMGIHYHGFGAPTKEELKHDFLWRIKKELPADGWISIFDRSQYEDIIMPHVYGTYPKKEWEARYDAINKFEQELVADGCAILKIYLVSSKDAQKEHFLKRLEDPVKFWKFDPSDLDARERWDEYIEAYQEVFERTSMPNAPWYLVPADHRWYSRMVVSELLRNVLKNFNLTWPPLDVNKDEVLARLKED